ncbi:serine hydrolase domain-containing protein [Mucilaginibacter gilvus]|uniref:Class A beta-lactamase-related serine hydrolase n=1 Tax=Mucilaginibacter gilvus TaxID=2305909 RepID=A0A3S3UUJ7_9SPHI|nr:serine hydrolase domain-containing protein [Mucilaginibacter gilvus]RWY50904.1 class A beta-lactamase-related serine hydrolase [Mucilaginibacter gilvus]
MKKKLARTIMISVLLSTAIYHCNAQSKFEKLSFQLDSVIKKNGIPGMAVVLVNQKNTIYSGAWGYANTNTKQPYTTNTIQNIGSVSKSFIALAIMKAVELKYFTLDTDINEVLPFKVVNPQHPLDKITIRQLTTHTSGILDNPAIYPNTYRFNGDTIGTDPRVLQALRSLGYNSMVKDSSMKGFFYNYLSDKGKYYSKENFDADGAGSNYNYSNLGSALAAYLIEIRSGMSYATFADRYILSPLKMNNSGWYLTAVNKKLHAQLYYNGLNVPLYSLLTYPDGGLRTSANDLSKYLMAMTRGYKGQSNLLRPDLLKQIFTKQFDTAHAPGKINMANRNKGLFWNLFSDGTIGIDGDDPGVSTYVFFNPATGLGGLFICNTFLSDKQPIINLLTKAVATNN